MVTDDSSLAVSNFPWARGDSQGVARCQEGCTGKTRSHKATKPHGELKLKKNKKN